MASTISDGNDICVSIPHPASTRQRILVQEFFYGCGNVSLRDLRDASDHSGLGGGRRPSGVQGEGAIRTVTLVSSHERIDSLFLRKGDHIELAKIALAAKGDVKMTNDEVTAVMNDLQTCRTHAKSALPEFNQLLEQVKHLKTRIEAYLKALKSLPFHLDAIRAHAVLNFSKATDQPLWEVR